VQATNTLSVSLPLELEVLLLLLLLLLLQATPEPEEEEEAEAPAAKPSLFGGFGTSKVGLAAAAAAGFVKLQSLRSQGA
jgi:hypothetical protein